MIDKIKFNWQEWSSGGKTIFVSSCLAILSLFLPWVDIEIATSNGFSEGGIFLFALYIYPVVMLFQNREIKKPWGLVCGVVAILLSSGYIVNSSVEFFGEAVDIGGSGLYLMFIASVALLIGIQKYSPYAESVSESD